MWYRFNRWFFKAWFWLQFRYRAEGQHHEPEPPYLIIANHTSLIDIPLVGMAVRTPVSFMSKEELMHPSALRLWIQSLGSFFVRRGEPDRAAVRTALTLLTQGKVVCLFPEGTRSADGRLQPLQTGAAYLALKTGVRVLPVAIIGAHRIMPKGVSWPRRGRAVMSVGAALAVPKVEGKISHQLQQEWTDRFARVLADLLPPDQRPLPITPPAGPGRTARIEPERNNPVHHPVASLPADARDQPSPFSYRTREHFISQLSDQQFDVLVVGGGITGAGIAYAAASRGLRVVLVDQGDFASGTSSRSSRLIHGGVRYLRHGHIRIVVHAQREQARLAKVAPHLVRPITFLFPLYQDAPVSPLGVRLLMSMYHSLRPFDLRLPQASLSVEQTLAHEPLLRRAGLQAGLLFQEFFTHDARLVLETVLGAHQFGALPINYMRVAEYLVSRGKVIGGILQDQLTGRTLDVKARVVVNATGPWSDRLPGSPHAFRHRLRLTKGVHLIFSRRRLPIAQGVIFFSPKDGRPLMAIPVENLVIVGPTETEFEGDPGAVTVEREDTQYLLEAVSEYLPGARVTFDDVIGAWAGLRPLHDQASRSPGKISREYHIEWGPEGLLFVLGGKLTLHRRAASEVMMFLNSRLGGHPAGHRPGRNRQPLPGALWDRPQEEVMRALRQGEIADSSALHLMQTYGSRSLLLLDLLTEKPEWRNPILPELPSLWAEVPFSIGWEMAVKRQDFLERRSDLSLRARAAGSSIPVELDTLWTSLSGPAPATQRSSQKEETV